MDISDYYSRSFNDLTENLNLFIPSLVGNAIIFVFLVLWLILAGFITYLFAYSIDISGNIQNFSWSLIAVIGILIIIAVIITMLIYAFMYAATIGMSKKTVNGHRSDLKVAWKKGKKYFGKIFFVEIITVILSLILCSPLIIGLFVANDYPDAVIIVIAVGGLIFIVGAIIIGLFFLLVNQSIVIGKKSLFASFKDSYKMFWKNKSKVFVVALINFIVGFCISFFLSFIPFIGGFLSLLVAIVLLPYFTLVLTYLYMDLKNMIQEGHAY